MILPSTSSEKISAPSAKITLHNVRRRNNTECEIICDNWRFEPEYAILNVCMRFFETAESRSENNRDNLTCNNCANNYKNIVNNNKSNNNNTANNRKTKVALSADTSVATSCKESTSSNAEERS